MAEPKLQTFQLKNTTSPPDPSAPEVTFWGSLGTSTLDQIKKWIDGADAGSVKLAGIYYSRAETLLNGFAADLKTKATDLAGHYTGPAAVETQKQLQALHASVRELARKLGEMGRSLQGYGDTLHWAQANVVESMDHDSRSDRDVDWAGRVPFYRLYRGDKRAADHLKKVNERIVEHYKQMPADVQQALPDPSVPDIPDFNTGAGSVPGPPGLGGDGVPANYPNSAFDPGSMPGGPGNPSGASGPGIGGTGSYPSGAGGSGPGSIGGHDGADNPYGGADPSGVTGTTLGTTPGAPPSAPSSSGDGSTSLAGYDPSLSGTSTTGYPTSAPGGPAFNGPGGTGPASGSGGPSGGIVPAVAGGAMPRGGASGAGSLGAPLLGGVPGGRGSGGDEQDQESSTWLHEDDDVWGGPEGATPGTLT